MALASATPKGFKIQGLTPTQMMVELASASDCATFPNCKGVTCIEGTYLYKGVSASAINTAYTPVYGMLIVNGASYTASSTSIDYDGATCKDRVVPYYIATNAGEIMEVTADSGAHTVSGTITVRRGVLGTTASAGGATTGGVADNAPLTVMNAIIGATPGFLIVTGLELPTDAGVKLFNAAL